MQLGFDRLIQAMDDLAPEFGMEVIAQIGRGEYVPRNMEARIGIAPDEFEKLVERCQLIVAHAGIGTILTAQRFKKPILLMPRRFDRGEHRNDHQVATVRHLHGRSGLLIAMDESELEARIAEGLTLSSAKVELSQSAFQLRSAIAGFIETGEL
jgi:UDP-N-acetylglucosamine transferase subunit ALG13